MVRKNGQNSMETDDMNKRADNHTKHHNSDCVKNKKKTYHSWKETFEIDSGNECTGVGECEEFFEFTQIESMAKNISLLSGKDLFTFFFTDGRKKDKMLVLSSSVQIATALFKDSHDATVEIEDVSKTDVLYWKFKDFEMVADEEQDVTSVFCDGLYLLEIKSADVLMVMLVMNDYIKEQQNIKVLPSA